MMGTSEGLTHTVARWDHNVPWPSPTHSIPTLGEKYAEILLRS